jgi:hypothetical protein
MLSFSIDFSAYAARLVFGTAGAEITPVSVTFWWTCGGETTTVSLLEQGWSLETREEGSTLLLDSDDCMGCLPIDPSLGGAVELDHLLFELMPEGEGQSNLVSLGDWGRVWVENNQGTPRLAWANSSSGDSGEWVRAC